MIEKEYNSDWNMGVGFYQQLEKLKALHIESFSMGFHKESLIYLMSELDWVSTDIGEGLTALRRDIDNLFFIISKKDVSEVPLQKKIIDIRRRIWDLEMKNNITRPKETNDLSNRPIAFINKR